MLRNVPNVNNDQNFGTFETHLLIGETSDYSLQQRRSLARFLTPRVPRAVQFPLLLWQGCNNIPFQSNFTNRNMLNCQAENMFSNSLHFPPLTSEFSHAKVRPRVKVREHARFDESAFRNSLWKILSTPTILIINGGRDVQGYPSTQSQCFVTVVR